MSAPTPLISVILVCKNPGTIIARALESLWVQKPNPPEIIVVDGLSSDGTRAWLDSHRSRLSALVSEPDNGVYDAMNKGIAAATGDWLLFLGADDRLSGDDVLHETAAHLERLQTGVAVGEAIYDDGRRYRLSRPPRPFARNFVHHQGAFYRRTLFAEGGFDPSLAIMGDYDLNLRLWSRGVRFEPLPLQVSLCGSKGLSDSGRWRVYHEEITVRHRYRSILFSWSWDVLSVVRWLRKKILRNFP